MELILKQKIAEKRRHNAVAVIMTSFVNLLFQMPDFAGNRLENAAVIFLLPVSQIACTKEEQEIN